MVSLDLPDSQDFPENLVGFKCIAILDDFYQQATY